MAPASGAQRMDRALRRWRTCAAFADDWAVSTVCLAEGTGPDACVAVGTVPPLADAWTDNFVANKFGQATTHWAKLMDRVERRVGNPCPLLLIGLPAAMISFDAAPVEQLPQDDAEEMS